MAKTKAKRLKKALSALGVAGLGVAGLSLAARSTGSVAEALTPGAAALQTALFEEEISDVSLATFHLDRDKVGTARSMLQLARCARGRRCGGACAHFRRCRCGCGCGCSKCAPPPPPSGGCYGGGCGSGPSPRVPCADNQQRDSSGNCVRPKPNVQ
jgi:hypothetical protein